MTADGNRAPAGLVRFGVFELDLATGELRKRGVRVALQEQPFQVLARLVTRPGELVTREELRRALWPDAVFVDFDHGLNKAVAKIRRALGDLAESPRYVETLERRGYRFIAPVDRVAAVERTSAVSAPAPPPPRFVPVRVVRLNSADGTIALGPGEHVIGRDPDSAVWIDSPVVSRRHALIVIADAQVTVEDLGSHNGTYVNDERCHAPRPLAHGDRIRVGPALLVVFDPPEPAATATEPGP
jgi:DNA-binding winged helix-turn-helix (wHTH) protein